MTDLSTFAALAGIDIGAWSDKPTTLNPGQKEAAKSLYTTPDGKLDIGIWEATPGRFTADRSQAAEFCHFLQGRIVMTHLDGTRVTLGPGDAIMLPRGWKGTWEILEQTRKIYVIYSGGDTPD
ncbi:cupin domain-containing protein [Paracoccus pacificus]|uniref:Cupin domain-containing protein n=1 Tax=Paracoccus pacificus TaxID=1463598 RepID=A0ABW4R387_9RHOB